MADIFGEIHEVRKGLWAFFIVLSGFWLAGQEKSARMDITLPGVKKKVVGAIEGDFWSNNSNNSKKILTGLTRSLPSS